MAAANRWALPAEYQLLLTSADSCSRKCKMRLSLQVLKPYLLCSCETSSFLPTTASGTCRKYCQYLRKQHRTGCSTKCVESWSTRWLALKMIIKLYVLHCDCPNGNKENSGCHPSHSCDMITTTQFNLLKKLHIIDRKHHKLSCKVGETWSGEVCAKLRVL